MHIASNPTYSTRITYPVRRFSSLPELVKSGRTRIHHVGMHNELPDIVTKDFAKNASISIIQRVKDFHTELE